MPEAQAVAKPEASHAKSPAPATSEQPALDVQTTPSLPATAARSSGPPADDPIERSRSTLQQLPSNAMRRQVGLALARQHGNAFAQRVLAPTPPATSSPRSSKRAAPVEAPNDVSEEIEPKADQVAERAKQLDAPPPPNQPPQSLVERQCLVCDDPVQRSPATITAPSSIRAKPSAEPARPAKEPAEASGSKPQADEGICPACGRRGSGTCACGQPFVPVERLTATGQVNALLQKKPAEPASAEVIQREEGEGGLLDSALNLVKSGFNNLRTQASGAVASLRQAATSGVDTLQSGLQSVTGQVTGAWDGIQNGAKDLLKAAEGQGTSLLGGITSHLGAVGSALAELDAGRLQSAWAAVTGAANQAWNAIKGIANGALTRGEGLWNQLQGTANGLVAGLRSRAEGLLSSLPGAAQAAQSQVKGLWDSLVGRVSGVLQKLPGWAAIERMWSGVWSEVQSAASSAVNLARSAWDGIQAKANSVWQGIQSTWAGVKKWASDKASGLVGGFERIAKAFSTSGIGGVIATITQTSKLFQAVRQVIKNPESLLQPMVQGISTMLSPLPQQTRTEAQNRVQAVGGGGGSGAPAAAGPPVMRQAAPAASTQGRRTAGLGTVLNNIYEITTDKALKIASNIGKYVLDTLKEMFWPPKTGAALGDDVTKMVQDLGKHWDRLSKPRTDSWGHFYEDASRLGSNLTELTLIIWRTVNTMLGRLFPYLTIILVVAGAVEGAVGGTVIAGLIEFFSAGAGTPVAAGAEAAGPLAGGLAGLKAAALIGQPLFYSFVAAEAASIIKSVADLLAVPETPREQGEDYEQISDSIIALAAAGLLVALTEIGAAIGRAFRGIAEAFRGEKPIAGGEGPAEGGGTPSDKGGNKASKPAPEADAVPDSETPVGEKGVAAEATTADGHKIKVLDNGRVFICTTCEEMTFKFDSEIKALEDIKENDPQAAFKKQQKALFEKANATTDPAEKAKLEAQAEDGFRKMREAARTGESVDVKVKAVNDIQDEAESAIAAAEKTLDGFPGRQLTEKNPALKTQLQGDLAVLKKQFQEARANAETAKELKDPAFLDESREHLDDIRAKADQLDDQAKKGTAEKDPTEPTGPLTDDQVRQMFADPKKTTHMPASEYSGGKHVRGATNAQRQANAVNGNGQYLADLNDSAITQLEREALQNGRIERRGSSYHVFHTFGRDVGFSAPSGARTGSVRVEWSAGTVHSHTQ